MLKTDRLVMRGWLVLSEADRPVVEISLVLSEGCGAAVCGMWGHTHE